MHTLQIVLAAAAAGLALAPAAAAQDQPPLRTGVELVLVDAQIVDRQGNPITGLTPEQFEVSIDGRRRKVVSAELIDANTGLPRGAGGGAPETASTARADNPNIYMIAVDQGSFRPVNAPSVVHAAREFLKRAQPNDLIGMVSFPQPGVLVQPTRDRAEVEAAISKLVGFSALKQMREFRYTLSDAIDVASHDREALDRVVQENCGRTAGIDTQMCANAVGLELNEAISLLELQASRSLAGLRSVVAGVRDIPGRKTLVVLSAGIPSGDRSGARMYMRSDAVTIGREAADSGILLYTLHLNTRFLDQFSPEAPSTMQTAMREAGVYARALEVFNGTAGGTFFEVNTGQDFAIDRMMRETSAYYLLGVEVEDADRDGKTHRIQVKVSARGATVRSRASVVIPKRQTEGLP